MKKKAILSVVLLSACFGFYWYIFRNRLPILDLEETDWLSNLAVIKFGNNEKKVSIGNSGEMKAGSTYSNKYKLMFFSENKEKHIMVFNLIDNLGQIVETKTIDFKTKITY